MTMEILLVRHGRPEGLVRNPISSRDVGQWVRRYNESGIDQRLMPPESVSRLVASAGCVVASNLRRSVESAAVLAPSRDVHIDPELREAVLPDSLGISVRMPPDVWVVLARVAWWLDWCRSEETVDATRRRAGRAADRLSVLAREHESVAVVGHGMFNWFIARELVKRGWRGPMMLPGAYWAWARFMPRRLPV
jgi:broad specificity phosphatase PhoE